MCSGTERAPADDATDRELVTRAMCGDTPAFEALYRRYWSFRVGFLRYFPSREDLDDAYQTLFIRLFKRFIAGTAFTDEGMVQPTFFVRYLTASLRHAGQASCQARDRQRRAADAEPDHLAAPEARPETDDAAAEVERVINAMAILSPDDQNLLLLHYVDKTSRAALAGKFGLGLAAVQKRFSRALQALRAHLGLEPPPGGCR